MRVALLGVGFDFDLVDHRPGLIVFRANGDKAFSFFKDESGGHRWQHVPANDKRGRIQTSTVTVAVLPEPTAVDVVINDRDLDWATCRGSGPGGQNRNKVESAVILTHTPTGISVRCENERSQEQNRRTALAVLRARLWEARENEVHSARAEDRKKQVGSGMRGDKRRTIREQDGVVTDHITGKRWRFKEYERGDW